MLLQYGSEASVSAVDHHRHATERQESRREEAFGEQLGFSNYLKKAACQSYESHLKATYN